MNDVRLSPEAQEDIKIALEHLHDARDDQFWKEDALGLGTTKVKEELDRHITELSTLLQHHQQAGGGTSA